MDSSTTTEAPSVKQRIVHAYIDRLREHGHPPLAVFPLCKSIGISEKEFFQEFPNLDAVESAFWRDQVAHVIAAVELSGEWEGFAAKQRALTFFFAWFEHALEIRSLVILRFGDLGTFEKPAWLRGFRDTFREFAKRTVAHGISTGEIAERGRLTAFYPDAIFTAFRNLVEFNIHDNSRGFERTDAYIEKSVQLAFELIRSQAIDSAFDLARFLAPQVKR